MWPMAVKRRASLRMRREWLWSLASVLSCQPPQPHWRGLAYMTGAQSSMTKNSCGYVWKPALQGPHLMISRQEYCEKVEEIRELIAEGEIYQINFTDRLKFGFAGRPWDLFATLCSEHPTPYAAFVNTGTEQVLSHSPELFFRIQGMAGLWCNR